MSAISYRNFDLSIEIIIKGRKRYRVRVLNSPAGEASAEFSLPFTEDKLENYILKMGQIRTGTRSLNSPEGQAAQEFGRKLYEAVFQNSVHECLHRSLDIINQQSGQGLRIRLRLANAPSLLEIPWEYIYDASVRRFLVHSKTTPLVRYLDLPQPTRPLMVHLPLRVLVMIANPRNDIQLNVEAEWDKMQSALADLVAQNLVTITRLPQGTLTALQHQLRKEQYHIFHFIGHGGFDSQSQEGVLLVENDAGLLRRVSGSDLGTLLHDYRSSLRLAVLNACDGTRTSKNDPFAGVAQNLVQQGIPAVIAMQFAISDQAAITLAHEFYSALADGEPVDAALAEARKAIYAAGNDIEWGTPVLYLRSDNGHLFDVTTPRNPQDHKAERTEEFEQQKQQRSHAEYIKKTYKYQEEFARAIQAQYPIETEIRSQLNNLHQQLELNIEDVVFIEQPLLAEAEAKYQAEQRKAAEEDERKQREKAEYANKLIRYQEELLRVLQMQYPIDEHVRNGLRDFQQSLGLSQLDVADIEKPLLVKAEAKYQAEQQKAAEEQERKQREKAEYADKLIRYQKEFLRVLQMQYPIDQDMQNGLRDFQQSLGLSQLDVADIEKPLLVKAEAKYQAEQRKAAEEQERKQREKRLYEDKLREYQQKFSEAIHRQYPLESDIRDNLNNLRQILGINQTDIVNIEKPLLAEAEAKYQTIKQKEQLNQAKNEKTNQNDVNLRVHTVTAILTIILASITLIVSLVASTESRLLLIYFVPMLVILWLANIAEKRRLLNEPYMKAAYTSYALLSVIYMIGVIIGGAIQLLTFMFTYSPEFRDQVKLDEVILNFLNHSSFFGLGIGLPALLGLLLLVRPVRRWCTRFFTIDIENPVHTIGLASTMLIVINFITIRQLVESTNVAQVGLSSSQLWESLSFSIQTGLITLIGVGWLSRRTLNEALDRLDIIKLNWQAVFLSIYVGSFLCLPIVLGKSLFDTDSLSQYNANSILGFISLNIAFVLNIDALMMGALQPRLGLIFTTVLYTLLAGSSLLSTPYTIMTLVVAVVAGLMRIRYKTASAMLVHFAYSMSVIILAYFGIL